MVYWSTTEKRGNFDKCLDFYIFIKRKYKTETEIRKSLRIVSLTYTLFYHGKIEQLGSRINSQLY